MKELLYLRIGDDYFMRQLTEELYVGSYSDIEELVSQGYLAIGDLRAAMKYDFLKGYEEIKLYVDHNRKIIDTCGYFCMNPYPCIVNYIIESRNFID